jgi:hypothetical protein
MSSRFCFSPSGHHSRDCLAILQELCVEVRSGLDALTSNCLNEFKKHLSRQEDLCATFKVAERRAAEASAIDSSRFMSPDDRRLADSLRMTRDRLAALNQRYAALLRRSNRSVNLLRMCCGIYIPGPGAATPPSSVCRNLSSEI